MEICGELFREMNGRPLELRVAGEHLIHPFHFIHQKFEIQREKMTTSRSQLVVKLWFRPRVMTRIALPSKLFRFNIFVPGDFLKVAFCWPMPLRGDF